jgi:ABC-type nickel/cobalt efflux system permease component RcnA
VKLAEGIRKHGFRKWYERELLTSHGHLVLTFLCMIGLFAGFEALSRNRASWLDQAVDIAAIALCALIGLWALRRYLYYLNHAEAAAHQADCPQCKAYGSFAVEAEDDAERVMTVCCRKCSHKWTIND